MLKTLFEQHRENLNYFFDNFSEQELSKLFPVIEKCKGTLFFTGVGKSGHVASKIASTLISCGTKAFYLPSADLLHGDIGIVTSDDLFFILSKSGETQELIQLIPFIQDRGCITIAVVSNEKCRLATLCDYSIVLPCKNELCPFDLAPTTSTLTQTIFGDVLAVALMNSKGFTLKEYAKNHPSGQIGKRATIKVHELMRREIPSCRATDQLFSILSDLSEKQCGCILVLDNETRLEGIFTDGDLRRSLQNRGGSALQEKLLSLMTKSPRTIHKDELAWKALEQMEKNRSSPITVLPVVDDDNKIVGLIKLHDLIQLGL